jgi:hypothetical protein
MGQGSGVSGLLYSQVIRVAIASLIGAVFLPATCGIYNKMAGGSRSPKSVPEPSMGKAMATMFVIALINAVFASFFAWVITTVGSAVGARQQNTILIAQLVSLPISLLVMSGFLSAILPTAFGRAFIVALLYLLIVVLVSGVVLGVMLLLFRFFGAGYFRF